MNYFLSWNPLVIPTYVMVDYDTAETAALEAVFSGNKVFLLTLIKSSQGQDKSKQLQNKTWNLFFQKW